jgi:hypothetical protein
LQPPEQGLLKTQLNGGGANYGIYKIQNIGKTEIHIFHGLVPSLSLGMKHIELDPFCDETGKSRNKI